MTVTMLSTDTHKHLVLPTKELREVYLRAIRARKVKWHYAVCYKDTRGFGLQLACNVKWLKPGQIYIDR